MKTLEELDLLSAIHVMGWIPRYGGLYEEVDLSEGSDMIFKSAVNFWVPTKNMTQAWQLWEKIRDEGEFCCMNIRAPIYEGWEVSLTKAGKIDDLQHKPTILIGGEASKMSAAETITKACLLAKGVSL